MVAVAVVFKGEEMDLNKFIFKISLGGQ